MRKRAFHAIGQWALSIGLLLALVPAVARANEPAVAVHGMVTTEQAQATRAGVAILRHGGNAVDAPSRSAMRLP